LQYKGVSKYGRNGKFMAQLYTNGKNRTIGTFGTAIKAALAYDQAAIKAGRKKSSIISRTDYQSNKRVI
jgi:hypothetical protein